MIKQILNLLLPNRCAITGKIVHDTMGLSPEGFTQIQFITDPHCDKCGAPLTFPKEICTLCANEIFAFQQARSVFVYDENSKKLIFQYKHGDRLNLSPILSRWMVQYGSSILSDADILIPVPLHPKRLRQRMYNQAAELVKEIGKYTKKPYILDALLRIKATLPQGHEDRHTRINNMQHAFQVNPTFQNKIQDKSLLIVDDVMTSGATLNECAKTLLPFNPKKISVLTLAKVLLN
jgi:ComF family protein